MMSYALRNFQSALETSGHNVANVNTPGYSRQRVDFAANDPHVFYSQGWKSLGQGVHISQIERIRDLYLDRSLTASNGQLGKFSAATSGLRSIEGVYGEPSDSGIVAAMGKFYDAWSGLGSNPTDPGAKFEVRNAGQVLADRVRGAWQDMDGQASQNKNQIDTLISQVNDLADQISKLNKSIVAASISGQSPNDLLDQRDQAIQQMGSLVNVHTETFQDGTVAVYAAGFAVVDNAGTLPFPTTYDPVAGTVTNGSVTNTVRSGTLAGLFIHSAEIANQQSRLDSLANEFRTAVNTVHMTGQNSIGTTNVRFFNDVTVPPQTGARDFDLDGLVKADIENVMSGVSGKPGDGGLALSLSASRDTAVASLGNKTFSNYMHETVDTLASMISYYSQATSTETAVNSQVSNQIQSVSGVSIDDEMADMVKFQRSYQAAAKALSTFDQMTQDLIGMLNR